MEVHQGNFSYFLDIAEEWGEDEKIKVILAVGECGYRFNLEQDDPNQFDIDLYEIDTMRDLAIDFVEQGAFW